MMDGWSAPLVYDLGPELLTTISNVQLATSVTLLVSDNTVVQFMLYRATAAEIQVDGFPSVIVL